jgi:hypothetical protein
VAGGEHDVGRDQRARAVAARAEDGDGVGRMLVGLPEAIGGDETRQILVPLAGGLLLFVFAMHALYISRRAAPEAPLETDE